MSNYPTTETQRKAAKEAVQNLCSLFGDASKIHELHLRVGNLIEAEVFDLNTDGQKYVIHGARDDINGSDYGCHPVDLEALGVAGAEQCCHADPPHPKCGEIAFKTVTASFVCGA